MWDILKTLAGIAVALALGTHLILSYRKVSAGRRAAPGLLYSEAKDVLDEAWYEETTAAGYPPLAGRFGGLPVRIQAVVDTLAVRKLPALWLLVTIPTPLPIGATFDLMMRPAGPTTFSNFDDLPETLARPPDFPEHAVIRSDDTNHVVPAHVIAPHLGLFRDGRAKELLITPKGLRIVWHLAEADRVRYGVFRQADFGAVRLDDTLLRDLLARLIAIRTAILEWSAAHT